MSRRPVVGIDLGATAIKAARVDARGRVLVRARTATRAAQGPGPVLDRVAELVRRLAGAKPLDGVGVGSCGLIAPGRGLVLEATATTPGWQGTEIAIELVRRTGLRCICDNDGSAAALGEARFGAGRGRRAVAMLTLGTGVGGGLVVDGEVVHGAGAMAATFGHLKVRRGGRRCACGTRGCLEAYASDWAFRRAYGAAAKEVFSAARRGDHDAARLVDEAADALGTALADIAHALNPDVIVVGGGIARGWPALRERTLETYERQALGAAFRSTAVVRGSLGNDAGIVGAATLLR